MDELIRMMTADGSVQAVAVTGHDMVERAREIHQCWSVGTAALGRSLMAASMMGDMLKAEEGSVTLQIKGGGPLGGITAVSDSQGNVRGYVVNGQIDIERKYQGKLDVGTAVGNQGTLTVLKDVGLKEPYIGSVQLISGEIAEDITAYFVESEQIPTACALGVLIAPEGTVAAAGGYLIQLLPGADDSVIDQLEQAIARVGPITTALQSGKDGVAILEELLDGMEPMLLERHPVEYRCYCSQERVSRALISMGKTELESIIVEQGEAELTCQFCDKVYHFDKNDLYGLLKEATSEAE